LHNICAPSLAALGLLLLSALFFPAFPAPVQGHRLVLDLAASAHAGVDPAQVLGQLVEHLLDVGPRLRGGLEEPELLGVGVLLPLFG